MEFGIIGGTGFYRAGQEGVESVELETAYGEVELQRTPFGAAEVVFLPRHGREHAVPPHRVNYRANMAALKKLAVKNVLSTAAVGSMSEQMPPGSLVALSQVLDFTRGRPSTFFDGADGKVVHVDMTEPYCPRLREELVAGAEVLGERFLPEGTYVCAEGPRFETAAEIRMFAAMGGDVVGMTGMPEAALAREAGMCYAAVAVVANWAAGVTAEPLSHGDVSAFVEEQMPRVRALFEWVVSNHVDGPCGCRSWTDD